MERGVHRPGRVAVVRLNVHSDVERSEVNSGGASGLTVGSTTLGSRWKVSPATLDGDDDDAPGEDGMASLVFIDDGDLRVEG